MSSPYGVIKELCVPRWRDDHIEFLEGLTRLKIEYEHMVTLHEITLVFSAKLDPLLSYSDNTTQMNSKIVAIVCEMVAFLILVKSGLGLSLKFYFTKIDWFHKCIFHLENDDNSGNKRIY